MFYLRAAEEEHVSPAEEGGGVGWERDGPRVRADANGMEVAND